MYGISTATLWFLLFTVMAFGYGVLRGVEWLVAHVMAHIHWVS